MADDRPSGIRLAVVAGVPVYLGWSWLLMAGVIIMIFGPGFAQSRPDLGVLAYGVAGLYAVSLLVAVLTHEGAHAAMARMFGHRVHRVVADLWGGHTAFDPSRGTPGSAAAIAVVGPLANGVLALAAVLAHPFVPPGVPSALVGAFGVINGLLAAFNLLPGLPLDGGQIVEAGVWKVTGRRPLARVVAGWSGRVLTLVTVALLLGIPLLQGQRPSSLSVIWVALVGMFLWRGASSAVEQGKALQALDTIRLDEVITPVPTLSDRASVSELGPTSVPPVVLDRAGIPVGIVMPGSTDAVPVEVRDRTPVSAVTTRQPPEWVVEIGPDGLLDLVRAFQTRRLQVLAVTEGGRLRGVATVESMNRALSRAQPPT